MDKIRWYIESSLIAKTRVYPVLKGLFEFKKEDGKIYFRHELKDKLKFSKKADYDLLKPHAQDECADIIVYCERPCNGVYKQYWLGKFTYFDCVVHLDRCWIEGEVEPNDDYNCWIEIEQEELNTFSGTGDIISTAATFSGNGAGRYVTQTCFDSYQETDNEIVSGEDAPDNSCLADPDNWCLKSYTVTNAECFEEDPDGQGTTQTCIYDTETVWHREEYDTDCVDGQPVPPPFGSGWNILNDDCAGSGTTTWWRCPPGVNQGGGDNDLVGPYNYGRLFNSVLEKIVSEANCGLTIKSDFFNINPEGNAPNNIAYQYAAANLHHITMHQISDINKPNASNPSSSAGWDMKPRDLMEDLRKIFNVWYEIKDGIFILEHYSFFTRNNGLNLVNHPMEMKLEYGGSDHDQFERNKYAVDQSFAFKAPTIKYDCGSGEKEIQTVLFSADIAYIENSLSSEDAEIEGFVLIANYLAEMDYVIIDNNSPLKWSNLLLNLHLHGKAFKSGKIGNQDVNFLSWEPYIKQEPFDYTLCCSDNFNPNDKITTRFSEGVVSSAEFNATTGKLTIELTY